MKHIVEIDAFDHCASEYDLRVEFYRLRSAGAFADVDATFRNAIVDAYRMRLLVLVATMIIERRP